MLIHQFHGIYFELYLQTEVTNLTLPHCRMRNGWAHICVFHVSTWTDNQHMGCVTVCFS